MKRKNPAEPENRLLILADDLTGALDTGVQFAKNGIKTLVYVSPENIVERAGNDAAVVVINTNTRHVSAEAAGMIVKKTAARFKNFSFFYKKTDSCLRGNIGAELEALMDTSGYGTLPFVPAYPKLKRITAEGRQYLNGVPLDKSSMANDPVNPVNESYIPAIIGKQSDLFVELIL